MSQITVIKKQSIIPEYLHNAIRKSVVNALNNVLSIENHYPKLLEEEKEALKRYLNASTQPLKDYILDKENDFYIRLETYLTMHCGFNLIKNEKFYIQLAVVLKKVGEVYPDFGLYEVFDAIDYCLAHNPNLCKSYDSKDGQSSFTSAWLTQILTYYNDNVSSFRSVVGRLMEPIEKEIEEKEAIKQSIIKKIRIHRDIACMVLQNIAKYVHTQSFLFDAGWTFEGKTFLSHLYDNMVYMDLLLPSLPGNEHPYYHIWLQWKDKKDANENYLSIEEKIAGSQKQIIREMIQEKIKPELIETTNEYMPDYSNSLYILALSFGFFHNAPDIDFTNDMDISKLIETYGKSIVNIYPLQDWEFAIRKEITGGIGTQLKESFNQTYK